MITLEIHYNRLIHTKHDLGVFVKLGDGVLQTETLRTINPSGIAGHGTGPTKATL